MQFNFIGPNFPITATHITSINLAIDENLYFFIQFNISMSNFLFQKIPSFLVFL